MRALVWMVVVLLPLFLTACACGNSYQCGFN